METRTAGRWVAVGIVVAWMGAGASAPRVRGADHAPGDGLDSATVERGRVALTLTGFLKPEWSDAAFGRAGRLWDEPAPDPERDPTAYAAAFRHRYGLHPAPYPNDGLPMGLRRALGPGGIKTGL